MSKKGFSRKGERRKNSSRSTRTEETTPLPDASPTNNSAPENSCEPVKLDVKKLGLHKEIARIEPAAAPEPYITPQQRQEPEHEWGAAPTRKQSRLIWYGLGATIIILFGFIFLVNHLSSKSDVDGEGLVKPWEIVPDDDDPSSPAYVFVSNPYKAKLECIEAFKKFTAAKNIAEVLPHIRQEENTQALLAKRWKPWPSPPDLSSLDLCAEEIETDTKRPFLWLTGTNQDQSSFHCFFVHQNDRFVVDWEATSQLGDTSLTTLSQFPTEAEITLRITLAASPYYLPSLSEKDYESYKITSFHDDTILWGYAARNSPVHQKITELLRSDAFLVESVPAARATIKLKRIDSIAGKNRFFITEMLHKDWIMP
jgi:hypothetical protein